MQSKENQQTFTYQTRLQLDSSSASLLDNCAQILSGVERCLFADISTGKDAGDLKSEYIKKHEITARQFNAIRIQLEGRIDSIKERQKLEISQVQDKIAVVKKKVQNLEKKKPSSEILHQKKRLFL